MKTDNIILRIDEQEHNIIRLKSELFGIKKSKYIRNACLSYWKDTKDIGIFKKLSELYKNSDQTNKDLIVDLLFEYYHINGFPYYKFTNEEKYKKLEQIKKTPSPLLDNNELQINTVGVDLANSFHPQMMKAGYNNILTPFEAYSDNDKFKDCIKRWLDLGKTPNIAGIRRILKTRNGVRSVTNFKPVIARYIYQTYCPDNGIVLDPCAGFSGRLLGCIASNKNIHYYGIDPDPETAMGNMNCASFFDYNNKFTFSLGCAEDIMKNLQGDRYDLVFTSPPYFDLERYGENKNQSYIKYPSYDEWLHKFLLRLMGESMRIIRKNGKIIINIKNDKKHDIINDLKDCCSHIKLYSVKRYKMLLPNNEFNRKDSTKHFESIFVFVK